ncbi:MAG: sulfatase [Myxococcales bacterium]|nr:sulfatase [Myxococcales bacterium]
MSFLQRAATFALPSVVVSLAAAGVAGLIEGLGSVDSALGVGTSIGFAAGLVVPLAIVVTLALRLLWAAWNPEQLRGQLIEENGGAPVVAGWTLYLLVSLLVLAVSAFTGVNLVWRASNSALLVAMSSSLIALCVSLLLVGLSQPLVRPLIRALRRFDAHRSGAVLRPRIIALAALAFVGLSTLLYWKFIIRPKIGYLELNALPYVASFSVLLAALSYLWLRFGKRTRQALLAQALLVVVCVGVASFTRHKRPFVLFDVWAEAPVAGFVIGFAYNLEKIRRDVDLGEVEPDSLPGAQHPDVLLITIDTLRADRMSVYGGAAEMPNLDALGKTGAVFERAFSPGNVTRRSLPTMMTGVRPMRTLGRIAGWAIRLDPRHVTVTERLRAAGYQTAGFFCCESHFGPRHKMSLDRGIEHMEFEHDGRALTTKMLDWLNERDKSPDADRPLFAWMHSLDPHDWARFAKERKVRGSNVEKYDAVLRDLDEHLGPLLTYVTETRSRDTLIIITSDHAEGLGDHGSKTHAQSLYNSEIHVPLIVAGNSTRPTRVRSVVSLDGLAPTLLELSGFVAPGMPVMDGKSVAPLLADGVSTSAEQGEAYAVMVKDRSVEKESFALIVGRHKLLQTPKGETLLFDIVEDPNEASDLAKAKPKVLERLEASLAARQQEDRIAPF